MYDVIKCLRMKQEIHFTKQFGKEIHSGNDFWSVNVTLQKKGIYQEILQKHTLFGENLAQI